jgi:hypothetical protein
MRLVRHLSLFLAWSEQASRRQKSVWACEGWVVEGMEEAQETRVYKELEAQRSLKAAAVPAAACWFWCE